MPTSTSNNIITARSQEPSGFSAIGHTGATSKTMLDDYTFTPKGATSVLLRAATENNDDDITGEVDASKEGTSKVPTRSISMLELNEIAEMVGFVESMDQLTHDLDTSTHLISSTNDDVSNTSSEDFLFYDDTDDTEEILVDPMRGPSNLPKICNEHPPAAPGNLQMSGMRRTMSVSSLRNRKFLQNCVSSTIPECQPITEEEGEVQEVEQSTQNDLKCNQIEEKESRSSHESSPPQPLRSSMKIESSESSDGLMKRNVSFSSIEIRPYKMTLGDHPCSIGPAMTLGWDYDEKKTSVIDVEKYEATREPRKGRQAMLMSVSHRQYILMRESGFTRAEIKNSMLEAKQIQKQRMKTAKNLKLMPLEEALEMTKKKFSLFKKGSKKI